MSQGREQIYSSLFQQLLDHLLSGTPRPVNGAMWVAGGAPTQSAPFVTCGRRKQPIASLSMNQYPAFWLTERGEQYRRNLTGGPPTVSLISYVQLESPVGADPNAITAATVNDLADAVEDAVEGPLPGTSRLEGLVLQSWINGREIVQVASGPGTWSIQIMEVETITWGRSS